uniref:Retrotrans_gag domain-containing protein n=1 Tax=Anopheles minimus TaxID=112268 RepID=A0A182VU37_9DIPT
MATLDPAFMASLAAMIAEALRTTTGAASEQARQETKPAAPRFTHPAFQSNEGTVCDYFNRMEWALQLHGIAEAKYTEYARSQGYQKRSYKELRQTLETHFDKKRNKFVESIKFRQIKQNKDETIAQYTLRLKQGAAHCEYGIFLDRMLIAQLLHDLTERNICDEVIAKNPDTFKDACDIATTLETTRHSRSIRVQSPQSQPTSWVTSPQRQRNLNRSPLTNGPTDRQDTRHLKAANNRTGIRIQIRVMAAEDLICGVIADSVMHVATSATRKVT